MFVSFLTIVLLVWDMGPGDLGTTSMTITILMKCFFTFANMGLFVLESDVHCFRSVLLGEGLPVAVLSFRRSF